MMWVLGIAAVWAVQSVVAYGLLCHYWDWCDEHFYRAISDAAEARSDTRFCASIAILPVSLGSAVVTLMTSSVPCGMRWSVRPSSKFGGPVR
jgi:hypothetical protein